MFVWAVVLLPIAVVAHLRQMHVERRRDVFDLRTQFASLQQLRAALATNYRNIDRLFDRFHRLEQRMHAIPRCY